MGLTESSCCKSRPDVHIQTVAASPERQSPDDAGRYGCTEWSHVESLLAHLPPDVHAELEDEAFQKRCHATFQDIVRTRNQGTSCNSVAGPAFLEGHDLIEAVHRSVPERFLKDRLHAAELDKLLLAFDTNGDGRISKAEFDLFCMWTVAMEVMGFFAGTSPFAKIATDTVADKLLIVSEFLDPDHILGRCALPSTVVAYYHPDGLTLDEFTVQIESAAHVRTKQGVFFKSVALANHGPDEVGLWNVCSDSLVSLRSLDVAWPRLMPMFRALAEMVADPTHRGHVDLLACNFAANQAGLDCLGMIESQVKARFAASTDATGNVALQGNWELERGGRNVAPIYFHEDMLGEFTKLMSPGLMYRASHPAKTPTQLMSPMPYAQRACKDEGYTDKEDPVYFIEKDPARRKQKEIASQSHSQGERIDYLPSDHALAAAAGGKAPKRGGGNPGPGPKVKAKAKAKKKPPVRHETAEEEKSDFV